MGRMLRDQVVLITGSSSGIGRALVGEFVRHGQRVVATARRPESIEDLARPGVLTRQLDVTDSGSVATAVAAAVQWGGRLDMVVNNAGFGLIGPVAELDLTELRGQIETNLMGAVRLIQAVVPHMAARKAGRIVNIGSVSGVTATPFAGGYCASKAALHAITDSLRMELAPFGIEVITVQPGAVKSRFGETSADGLERYRTGPSLYQEMADAIEMRARLSQDRPTPADDFVRHVVPRLLAQNPSLVIRFGRGSGILPALARLPVGTRDRIFSRKFGLPKR